LTPTIKVFWFGIAIYVASFFLVAVRNSGPLPVPCLGLFCAYFALFFPIIEINLGLRPFHHSPPLVLFSLMTAGWINPVFVLTAFLSLTERYPWAFTVLRIVTLSMFPFCWFFFFRVNAYPREGHVLWITGMLLVLFSERLASQMSSRLLKNSGIL
jgi:hypothetical protein